MNLSQLIEQLESCGFTCEAGPLENNTAFIELKRMAAMRPESPIAMQWKGNNFDEILAWAGDKISAPYRNTVKVLEIMTIVGAATLVHLNDWIVRDNLGNLYQCPDGLFQALWTPVSGDVYHLEYVDDNTVRLTKLA